MAVPYALVLKSLSFLAGILALIYLCFYFYRKKSGLISSTQQRIIVVERREIDQRTTISLVRIDDREVLIVAHQNGVAVHGIPESMLQKSFKEMKLAKSAVQ